MLITRSMIAQQLLGVISFFPLEGDKGHFFPQLKIYLQTALLHIIFYNDVFCFVLFHFATLKGNAYHL